MGVVELVNALWGLMTPEILFSVFWATFLGIIVGMLPGLTATMGIALLTGLTFLLHHLLKSREDHGEELHNDRRCNVRCNSEHQN